MIKLFGIKLFTGRKEKTFTGGQKSVKKQLYLMCGAPGSGKTTWLCNNAKGVIISRDEIRFRYMNCKDDHFFAHEKEVFNEFIETIQNYLDDKEGPTKIYVDATFMTQKARLKTLRKLDLSNVDYITVVVIRPSLEETIRRNHNRAYHAIVPDNIVTRMYRSYENPELDTEIPVHVLYIERENIE